MILIADSGSTRCDWVLLNPEGNVVFKTQTSGLNPNILTTQELHKRLAKSEELAHVQKDIKQIYFYGAGCGTEKNKLRLKRFLEKYFRRSKCEVHEDMRAACLSVTEEPSIVCVLGTGSNSCFFDGENLRFHTTSLGYVIMDEGSGNYFGKQLLKDYFYKKMPKEIAQKFNTTYNLYPSTIRQKLYKEDNPNAYLGDFAQFIFDNTAETGHSYFSNLLENGIQEFVENWILPYPQAKEYPIHFVGSIAYHTREIISTVLQRNGLILGNIQHQPIDGLVKYIQTHVIEETTA